MTDPDGEPARHRGPGEGSDLDRDPISEVRLLLPSMAYSDGLLDALPFIRYFGERSLSDLAMLRDRRRRVVLLTTEPIDPWIVNETIAALSDGDGNLRRGMHQRLDCVVPYRRGRESLADAVLADPSTMARLSDAVRSAPSALLVNFSASASTDELATRLGIPAEEGPAALAERWGTKAGSKRLFVEAGVRCPPGELAVVRSIAEATLAARRLAAVDPRLERVILKLDASDWGDGLGNAIVHCATLQRTGDLQSSVEALLQPWDAYCRELAGGGAIIEGFLEDATSWPSAQGRIDQDGGFQLLAAHEQILAGSEYRGCSFPLDPQISAEIGDAMARIAATLARHGVRGSFGVDFIVAGGQAHATEINLRKVGPSHVITAVHARAVDPGGDGRGSMIDAPVAYVNRRLHDPDLLTTLTPRTATHALQQAKLSYRRATGTGVILHIMGALQPVGYVEATSLAATPATAREIDQQAGEILTAAARRALDSTAVATASD